MSEVESSFSISHRSLSISDRSHSSKPVEVSNKIAPIVYPKNIELASNQEGAFATKSRLIKPKMSIEPKVP